MENSDIQAQILTQVQKIKDEQKQKIDQEEEKRKQVYIQQQAEIIINSEKYEVLNENEKKQLVIDYSISYLPKKFHQMLKRIYEILTLKNFIPSCYQPTQFKQKYPFILNLLDKYEISKKAEIFLDNLIREDDNRISEELRIENERKSKEAEEARISNEIQVNKQINEAFDFLIKYKGVSYLNSPYNHQYNSYIHYMKSGILENKFWEYINSRGGFSKCPTCGKVPKIIRKGNQTYQGNTTISFTEGFFKQEYQHLTGIPLSSTISHIHCCEFLLDFDTNIKYILASKVVFEKPKKEFIIIEGKYKTVSYVEYNSSDPYGKESKRHQDILETQKEMEETELKMKALQERLKQLDKVINK